MNVIKRSGEEVVFDASKIENAIKKANKATTHNQMTDELIHSVTQSVIDKCENLKRSPNVEEIQDKVEGEMMEHRCIAVAHNYITYRYERALIRKANSTDKQIMSLLERNNEEVKQENSNKNPLVNSVQRDYMAGEVSKDITKRFLLPQDVMEAHEKGIIHFHDSDYFAQHMHNCCLVNLEDMLQNGTVISETMIEKPHSFSTACNVATQIIAQVASSQYGGQSITLSHLAPFVQVSREKARREVKEELESLNLDSSEDTVNKYQKKIDLLGYKDSYSAIIFLNVRLVSSILLFFVLLYFLKYGYIIAPIATFLYFLVLPKFAIDKKVEKRAEKLDNEAMYFFEVLTLSLETGRNLKTALEITARNIDSELSDEFKRALDEVKYGKGLNEALDSLKTRIPSDTINNIILNISQSNIFGNSIIETMYNQIDYIRDRQIMRTKARINKIPLKVSVVSVIFFIPLLLLLILSPVIIDYLS